MRSFPALYAIWTPHSLCHQDDRRRERVAYSTQAGNSPDGAMHSMDSTRFDSGTMAQAAVLWNYMASFRAAAPCDAVVVCCSYDLRVCDHACDLIRGGLSRRLVLSGKTGNWTRHLWTQTEAAVFRKRALENGLGEEAILLEDRSTNFGENVAFTRALLPDARAITFVTKPAAVLRVKLTAEVQWPGISRFVSCPDLRFPDDISPV